MAILRPDWRKGPVGLVGCGQVGTLLAQRLARLGTPCLCYDPWVQAPDLPQAGLAQVLRCPVVSLHCSLVRDGPHPSYRLLGAPELELLPSGALLINSARGDCVDGAALLARPDLVLALDVWPGEPHPCADLVRVAHLTTPHIAGYSRLSERRVGDALGRALAEHFRLPLPVAPPLPPPLPLSLASDADLNQALLAICPLDSAQMEHAGDFQRLRRSYVKRLECADYSIDARHSLAPDLAVLGVAMQG